MIQHFSQIFYTIFTLFLQIFSFKLLWIFLFIISCTSMFISVASKNNTKELEKNIFYGDESDDESLKICQSVESLQSKLKNLIEDLHDKENNLKKSQNQIQCAEKFLSFIEFNKTNHVDRYKNLLAGLRHDLENTEIEVKSLQHEINNLTTRRESLKNDVLKQQEDYQEILSSLKKELENTDDQKHPIVSNFSTLRKTKPMATLLPNLLQADIKT